MLVILFTGQQLAGSYERFGVSGPEKLYRVSQTIARPTASPVDGAVREVQR